MPSIADSTCHAFPIADALAEGWQKMAEQEQEQELLLNSPSTPTSSTSTRDTDTRGWEDELDLDHYRNAPSGVGPLAFTWSDKPHRLAYDLVAEVRRLRLELDRTEGDLAVALREASNARAERDALSADIDKLTSALERTERNFRLAVAGKPVRDMCETLAENAAALAAGLAAPEAEPAPTGCRFVSGADHCVPSCVSVGCLAAPVGETPTTPKTLLEALGVDPEAPAVKMIEEKMREEFAAIRESERQASVAAPGVVIGDASAWDSAPPLYVPDETAVDRKLAALRHRAFSEPVGETPDEPPTGSNCYRMDAHKPHDWTTGVSGLGMFKIPHHCQGIPALPVEETQHG